MSNNSSTGNVPQDSDETRNPDSHSPLTDAVVADTSETHSGAGEAIPQPRGRSGAGSSHRDVADTRLTAPRVDRFHPHLAILADLSTSTHGSDSVAVELPLGTSIRRNRSARLIGPTLDHAIFGFLRSQTVELPITLQYLISGLDGAPYFADLASTVSPSLAAAIVSEAYMHAGSLRGEEVNRHIAMKGQSQGLNDETITRLQTAASELATTLTRKANSSTLAALLRQPGGAEDVNGALREPLDITPQLYSAAVIALTEVVRMLSSGEPIASVSNALSTLMTDPAFQRMFAISRAMTLSALPRRVMSLYAVEDYWSTYTGSISPLPAIRPISTSKVVDTLPDDLRTIFSVPKHDVLDQYKYFSVSCPMSDANITLADVVRTVLDFDRNVLPIEVAKNVDLLDLIAYNVVRGRSVGVPEFPYAGRDLFQSPQFQRLAGHIALKMMHSSSSAIMGTIRTLLTGVKKSEDNLLASVTLETAARVAATIVESYTSLRNTLVEILDDHTEYSYRVTVYNETLGKDETELAQSMIVRRWYEYYTRALNVLREQPIAAYDPSFIFHPTRILQVQRLIDLKPAPVAHTLVHHPFFGYSPDGKFTIEAPVYEQEGGSVFHAAKSSADAVGDHQAVEAYRLLGRTASYYSVVSTYIEAQYGLPGPLEAVTRLIPISTFKAFLGTGYADTARNQKILSPFTIVAELIQRRSPSVLTDTEHAILRYALLEFVPSDAGLQSIDQGTISQILMSMRPRVDTNNLIYHDKDGKQRIAHFQEHTFFDTGSNSFVFIFDQHNPFVVESTEPLLPLHSLPYPLFAAKQLRELVVALPVGALVAPIPSELKATRIAELPTRSPGRYRVEQAEDLTPTQEVAEVGAEQLRQNPVVFDFSNIEIE